MIDIIIVMLINVMNVLDIQYVIVIEHVIFSYYNGYYKDNDNKYYKCI